MKHKITRLGNREIRYFENGDKVKCVTYSHIKKRMIWVEGVIGGFNPSEWNYPKSFWDMVKNDPMYPPSRLFCLTAIKFPSETCQAL